MRAGWGEAGKIVCLVESAAWIEGRVGGARCRLREVNNCSNGQIMYVASSDRRARQRETGEAYMHLW